MDVLAARREARMRRILENSESRLRKIAGGQEINSTEDNEVGSTRTSRTSVHGDCIHPETNNPPRSELNFNDFLANPLLNDLNVAPFNADLPNQLMALNLTPSTPSSPEEETLSVSATTSKYSKALLISIIAVVFAFFLALVNRFSNDEVVISQVNTIFAPLLLFELYDLVFAANRQPSNNTLHSLVLFISRQKGILFVKVATILLRFGDIINDVFVYFFVYMMCTLIIRAGGYVI